MASKTAWMLRGTGKMVHSIPASTIQPASAEVSSESGFEVLCGYNWHEDEKTISVPGGPPKWAPLPLPATLSPNSDHRNMDQVTTQVPVHPFEPVFQAMSITNPDMRLDEVDIIVNRNSLRKLLDFVSGKQQYAFRMDLHMVKDTLFICRRERNFGSLVHGPHDPGFGHSFEDAFTKTEEELKSSGGHHRVIRYRLGQLNCIVRFEVDAYYEDSDESNSASTSPQALEDAINLMAHLDLNQAPPQSAMKGATMVVRRGTFVSSSKLAEIKLGKSAGAIPQLWFGRTPHLLTGKHDGGVVNSTRHTHEGLRFGEWEADNQDKLRKLVSLLAELKRVVSKTQGKAAILLCRHKGAPLQIFEAKNGIRVLPADILAKHWDLRELKGNQE
ncbi:geranylgeranyl pyrophosphate synthetase [Periconia macrospinosa]|uniref:Geranylgeranyl pyrophosphate synthetase n=1 Tax=Periconia macrospinosa TaxID=97972 RepID=A0A2V1D286_9PLEO|nr:geranylgeranyl pyrophosphate synthetase [Periconia macrospinosa]